MKAYAVALDGHDMRDIEVAIWRLIRGEIDWHNGQYSPSAPLLGGVVVKARNQRLESESRTKRYTIPSLPKPDVPAATPEERQRVAARLARFDAEMAALDTERPTEASRAEHWSKVQVRFNPPQDPASLMKRLMGVDYCVGNDAEGEAA